MASECVFCGSVMPKRSRAKEHVCPAWLIERLGIAEEGTTVFQRNFVTRKGSIRGQAISASLSGRVCAKCNGGWMSRLEVAVKPVFEKLWTRTTTLADLTREERMILCRWAAKTGYAEFSASEHHSRVPPNHPITLKESDGLPGGVFVVGALVKANQKFATYVANQWEVFGRWSEDEHEAISAGAYKMAILVDNVLLMTCFQPFADHGVALTSQLHYPLSHQADQFTWLTPLFDPPTALEMTDGQQLYARQVWLIQPRYTPHPWQSLVTLENGLSWRIDARPRAPLS